MSTIGWVHPIDESDQWDGFNEPGIEHFSGSPIRHLAREVVQNSLDSHDESSNLPVRVVINEASIKTSEIPGIEELKITLSLCLKSAENESAKAKQFFENTIKDLEKSRVKVLEISDYNTKGMSGPVKNGTPYYAFMKAKGQSKKSSETATGSFGIGKFAPYAVSRLRTVFVSTVFQEREAVFNQYTQGKSILMSYDDEFDKRHVGVGFWGVREKCQPVEGKSKELPSWLVRASTKEDLQKNVGTKLTILAFDGQTGWQESLAASIAENFFGAINSSKLEVLIDKKYSVNGVGLNEILDSKDIALAIANEKNEPEQFENSKFYYKCLSSHENVFIEQHQNLHLGLCELKILIGENLPKKVAFLRNGMFISDNLGLPGLKNFSEFKDFVAVFQCKDSKGIELLRSMEPPRHDDFEPDRLNTKEEQARGRRALKEMATWVREMLRRRAKDPVSEITKLDELKEFFADESEDGKGNGIEEVNPFGKIIIKAKPVSVKKSRTIADGLGNATGDGKVAEVGNTNTGNEKNSPNSTAGGGQEESSGASGLPRTIAPLSNLRAIILGDRSRRLSLTPLIDANCEIVLYEAGADAEYEISVTKSSAGEIKNGKLRIKVKKGERQSFDIELNESFDGALKVVAYEI